MTGAFHTTHSCAKAYSVVGADGVRLSGVVTLTSIDADAAGSLRAAFVKFDEKLERLLEQIAFSVSMSGVHQKGKCVEGEMTITFHTANDVGAMPPDKT